MGKKVEYQPPQKFKNYSLSTSKPLRSHYVYKEKVWTVSEQIYKKLKKIADLLESIYPKLTDDFDKNIKTVVGKNIKTLIEDLNLMQRGLLKDPNSFNTKKLKTNQHCINEMKNVCDTLQTVRTYENEYKNLGKIKHALHELELLIQPSSLDKSLEKVLMKNKPKKGPVNKGQKLAEATKKIKEKPTLKPKKQKPISKKAKPATKLLKAKKIDTKQSKKSRAPVHKRKLTKQAATKPQLSAKRKTKS